MTGRSRTDGLTAPILAHKPTNRWRAKGLLGEAQASWAIPERSSEGSGQVGLGGIISIAATQMGGGRILKIGVGFYQGDHVEVEVPWL